MNPMLLTQPSISLPKNRSQLFSQKGFSLIELMVVVAIIGILSAIAIPQINKYMARARQTEAKTNLASIYTANKAFFAEFNIYDSRFDVIGYRPEGKLRYNIGWQAAAGQCVLASYGYTGGVGSGATNAMGQCGGVANIAANGSIVAGSCAVMADGEPNLTGSALNCTASFTAATGGKIATTATFDRWTINEIKTLINTQDGTQ